MNNFFFGDVAVNRHSYFLQKVVIKTIYDIPKSVEFVISIP